MQYVLGAGQLESSFVKKDLSPTEQVENEQCSTSLWQRWAAISWTALGKDLPAGQANCPSSFHRISKILL